jgi:hypothetical protein
MFASPLLSVVLTALLVSKPAIAAGLYTKNSPVIQVDAKSYESLIAKSNYTSVSLSPLNRVFLLTIRTIDCRVLRPVVRPLPES